MSKSVVSTKLIIVGGGPAGLTAGIYAARAGLQPIIAAGNITTSNIPGGQLMITTEVENFPGFPDGGISGPELVERMKKQALDFGAVIIDKFATNFEFSTENSKHRLTIGEQLYETDAIILANGARARWLGAQNEEKFINKGISACATCDGPLPCFRDKDIVVVGGGDTACEEASFLTKFARKVWIVHRRNKLRASKIMTERILHNNKIEILWNTKIIGYYGNTPKEEIDVLNTNIVGYYGDDMLKGVKLLVDDKEEKSLDCAGVFMAIGHIPNTDGLEHTGLLDDNRYIKVYNNVYTDVSGVFAAGDCHDTIYRQAITASGFGCMASIAVERWLHS
jgi:thioredoxin reductase (NADPH)